MKNTRKNTLRAMGICLLACLMLAGCGTDSSTAPTGSSAAESSADTTSAAANETTSAPVNDSKAETTTSANSQTESSSNEENRDADFAWFASGVYSVTINGKSDSDYYVFYDKTSGKTTNGISGMGLPFACEQSKGSVIFHMGGIENTSEMKMSMNESGKISGTMDGKTYVFTVLEGVSAEGFDAKEYESASSSDENSNIPADSEIISDDGQNPIMNFIGNYSNGRAIMLVSAKGKTDASVKITWGSSAFDSTTWTMSGAVSIDEKEMTITYKDCTKESYHYSSDGTLERDDVEYSNGTGKIRFNIADNTVHWDDDKENAGEGSVFRYTTIE